MFGGGGEIKGKMEHIEKFHLSGVLELGLLERRYLYEIYENTTTSLSRACSLGIWEDWVEAMQRKLGVFERHSLRSTRTGRTTVICQHHHFSSSRTPVGF